MASPNGSKIPQDLPLAGGTPSLAYATPNARPDLPFTDQRGVLRTLGVVLIVLGSFTTCLTFTLPMALIAPRMAGIPGPAPRDLAAAALIYVLSSVVLITLGVGSLRIRRWSRPIVVIVGGTAALGGLASTLSWLLFAPSIQRTMAAAAAAANTPAAAPTTAAASTMPATAPATLSATPPSVVYGITVGAVLGGVVFSVLLPGAFAWFYSRKSVRQTYDYFDPGPSWTDRAPTPVLALSFWLAIGSLFALNFVLWGVAPVFGRLVTGVPAIAVLVLASAVLSALAIGVYRLNRLAWWATAAFVVIAMVSAATTYARVDPLDVYRLAGSPPAQVELLEQMGMARRSMLVGPPIVYGVALLGYLMWVRKYFTVGLNARG
jgi:hypothetical protein